VTNSAYPESELTGRIIGAAIGVHKKLGPGHVEKIYQRALTRELFKQGLRAQSQVKVEILYDGGRVGFQVLDLVVGGRVAVELKAVSEVSDLHVSQVISYLKATGLQVGLILNFAKGKLEIKRVILSCSD